MNTYFRTWVEIDGKALEHNLKVFLNLIPERTRLMAVVKSNAYGHGLSLTAKLLRNFQFPISPPNFGEARSTLLSGNFQKRLWFGVDSIVEALRLRKDGIKNPILVLGATLPSRMKEAAGANIILTVSNFESLQALVALKHRPFFHLKIDTGMHRQGFLPKQTAELIKLLQLNKMIPQGIYTHFASAKDPAYPGYTASQMEKFRIAISDFKKAGYNDIVCHAAASGGAILFPETHLDMVRVGMSLYGYFPSMEAKTHRQDIDLKPVLAWKTIVAETKKIPKGAFVGYDLSEKVRRDTRIAVLPVGYWHGYDRGLSSTGEVLVRGARCRILGRICMDMMVIDVTEVPGAKTGDEAVLIGRQKKEEIMADELALKIGTSHYEFLTRINPLIKRII